MRKKSVHTKDPFRIFPRVTKKDRESLQQSIEAVGLLNPVVIDENGHIIDGHIRRDICDELGFDWYKNARTNNIIPIGNTVLFLTNSGAGELHVEPAMLVLSLGVEKWKSSNLPEH